MDAKTVFYLLCLASLIGCAESKKQDAEKPNIIYIYTDQQSATMMSCSGNEWLKTPAMDYLAENGIRFTRAYSPNPVCSPSRISLMTGRFPGYFFDVDGNQVRENRGAMKIPQVSEEVLSTTIASFLNKAGYELYFGGKEHLPKSLRPTVLGFNDFCDDERGELALEAAKVIKADHDKPYFMIVSLINPHDICYMAIREFAVTESAKGLVERGVNEIAHLDSAMQMPEGVSLEQFFESYCPPVPENYEPQFEEPEAIKSLIEKRPFRQNARDNFTDEQWRLHRWAYLRLTEFVDQKVQVILDAVKESDQEENTLIIFSSDHGDNDASHRMEHKTTLYEESANIPFIAMWKGHIPAGVVDKKHLISNGLDLLPTICDIAGIEGRSDPRGRSLTPLFKGKSDNIEWRSTLGVESEIGRMVVDQDGFKYIRYDRVGIEEQLLNLNEDPYETTHFTNDPNYAEKLRALREAYDTEWFK
ncbi:MAG: sulfatase-like hydrolase/transferase [Bacteroidetes bacterium]|nr:sulfatase-like hydrolase/transferase [Bacteroidota bacterium]